MLLNRISLVELCPVVSHLYPVMNIFDITKDGNSFLDCKVTLLRETELFLLDMCKGDIGKGQSGHITHHHHHLAPFSYTYHDASFLPIPSRGRFDVLLQNLCAH